MYVMSWWSSLYQQNRENCHLNHSSQVKALYILAMKIGEMDPGNEHVSHQCVYLALFCLRTLSASTIGIGRFYL